MKPAAFLGIAIVALALGSTACVPSGRMSGTEPSGFSGRYAVPLPEFGTPVTEGEIREAYARYGAAAIVRKLHTENAANWNMVMNRIAAGDAAWIDCAAEYLIPGADAAASEDILVSLAYGLQNNPRAVLALSVEQGISLESVCTMPFDEAEQGFGERYGKKAVTALRKITVPELAEPRDQCLRLLRDSLARNEYTAR